jgi:tRNA nucleotidyltransferase (CCA-adding enzyme)
VTFNIKIPVNANKLINILQQAGYSAYVVGGCVRDSILGRIPHDWDICTSATPAEMLKVFNDFPIIETGLQHGTITVMVDGEGYEITTFRIDGEYSDNRRPDCVIFTGKLEEDLSRRDFTINALAYNDIEGLIDPFGGVADIKNRLIRCVGNAWDRFDEDALRVLRALRFSCQLGFAIEYDTSAAILDKAHLLSNISKERITSEFCKMLCTKNFATIMSLYNTVFCQFIPTINDMVNFDQKNPAHEYLLWRHTASAINHCDSLDLVTRLAVFFHDFGKPYCYQEDVEGFRHFKGHGKVGAEIVDELMVSLKFDNKTRNAVTTLVYYHDSPLEVDAASIKRWLNKLGVEQFKRLLAVRVADIKGSRYDYNIERLIKITKIEENLGKILYNDECYSLTDLAVNGSDLIALGIHPGTYIGRTLNDLLQLVINGEIENNKEALLNTILSNNNDLFYYLQEDLL